MKYRTLDGLPAEGDVVSPGPLHQTVWLQRPDRTFAVVKVNVANPVEVEYEAPQYIPPVPHEIEQLAQEIVDRYREVCKVFSPLGAVPHHPDHDWAVGILAKAEEARKSRLPFIKLHGLDLGKRLDDAPFENHVGRANSSIGEAKWGALSTVDAEIDGEEVEMTNTDYRKHVKKTARQKD
ncbi:hypothetical protein [Nocardia jiangxiensis]|uniref:hypothetical protein n=1 Tax=Nocardia jiangxiensis TaxID=282685 RepID=UPI0002D9886D|nr:hypothetical protein [Nocardia jiangxiensis]